MNEEKIGESEKLMGGGVAECSVGLPYNSRRSTGKTLFTLDYGMEVVIPLEVGLPTIKTEALIRVLMIRASPSILIGPSLEGTEPL